MGDHDETDPTALDDPDPAGNCGAARYQSHARGGVRHVPRWELPRLQKLQILRALPRWWHLQRLPLTCQHASGDTLTPISSGVLASSPAVGRRRRFKSGL